MTEHVFSSEKIRQLQELLLQPGKIVITTHHKPDGDALGSSLGLMHVLAKAGHSVTVVVPSEFPAFLDWMNGSRNAIDFRKHPHKVKDALKNAELLFCLDFNDPSRVEKMQAEITGLEIPMVLVDHHLDPKAGFCNIQFSYPALGSTCELLVHLLVAMNLDHHIDREAAECLYAGIMTDTGSFRFNSVTAGTHRVIARLMEAGARNYFIHEQIYDTNSYWKLKFLGFTLHEHMEVLEEFNTVVFSASQADMDRFHHEPGDLEGVVNYGLSINKIKMAVLFSERDNLVKISFRSKGSFSVKDIAEKYFEGGGHRNAAGGRSELSLLDTLNKFKALLPSYKDELNRES
ncbi:MAG: bifunctional oligoribonuclease/PAP phosphatase NrnA [Bacteroidetes bacterium]|nr:bifunctional oligoribonuclease/PAP phosphatase NrnA [Bacteroidota bacterium]